MKRLSAVRSRGLLYSLGIVFNRLIPAAVFRFRVFQILELDTELAIQPVSGLDDQIITIVRCQTPAEVESAEQLTFATIEARDPSSEFQTAWIARMDDINCGGVWTTEKSFDETELGVRIELPVEGIWIYAAYIDKAFRRKGIYRRLLGGVISQLRSANALMQDEPNHIACRFFVSINPWNKPSMAAHSELVKRTIGTCYVARFFGAAIAFSSGHIKVHPRLKFSVQSDPIRVRWSIT
ncbi:MAG: GNAT family N-acetyltransferase [Pirellulaceae bacterium]